MTPGAALVPLDPDRCPDCKGSLVSSSWWQPALLRHGGYGATRLTSTRYCSKDGWSLTARVVEVRP